MSLRDLLNSISGARCDECYGDYPVDTLSCDSREDQKDGLFVALSGHQFNGADFIKDAVDIMERNPSIGALQAKILQPDK